MCNNNNSFVYTTDKKVKHATIPINYQNNNRKSKGVVNENNVGRRGSPDKPPVLGYFYGVIR